MHTQASLHPFSPQHRALWRARSQTKGTELVSAHPDPACLFPAGSSGGQGGWGWLLRGLLLTSQRWTRTEHDRFFCTGILSWRSPFATCLDVNPERQQEMWDHLLSYQSTFQSKVRKKKKQSKVRLDHNQRAKWHPQTQNRSQKEGGRLAPLWS